MKKKILIASLLACSCLSGMAQVNESEKWSMTAWWGMNQTKQKEMSSKAGLMLGMGVDYHITGPWAVQSGLYYQSQNYGEGIGGDVTRIGIPLTAKCYVWRSLAIEAGVQVDFRIAGGNTDVPAYTYSGAIGTIETHWADDVYTWLPVGLSYEMGNFVVGARYLFGLKKIELSGTAKMTYSSTNWTYEGDHAPQMLQLMMGYRF
jgi:hypothetical protein